MKYISIKKIIYLLTYYSGAVYVIRTLYNKLFNNPVKVLYAHRIISKDDKYYDFLKVLNYMTWEEFEKKIKYINKHYRFISIDDFLKYSKENKYPANCVVLTFDDGYRCNYEKVFPILKKYKIPITIFIATDYMNTKNLLWHDKLIVAIWETNKKQIKIPDISKIRYALETTKDKVNTYNDITVKLKKLNNTTKEKTLQVIIDKLNVSADLFDNNTMLCWDEIRKMQDSGLVTFGAHTVTHSILTKISLEQVEYELVESKKIIEKELRRPIKYLAYPNGKFNSRIQNITRKTGYDCAFAVAGDNYEVIHNIYSIYRIGFISEAFYMFALRVAGVNRLLSKMPIIARNAQNWLPGYMVNRFNVMIEKKTKGPVHVLLCICDHFEPLWGGASMEDGMRRVKKWCDKYPQIASKHKDCEGNMPKYTFFYPEEEYISEYMDLLSDLCHKGYGEVEIHLHHDDDSEDNLKNILLNYKNTLANKHKFLSIDKNSGEIAYGFIHGNWALNNSRRDGRWCGVDNELQILKETGCYADFTMPSVPDETQTQKVNSIYYANNNSNMPKSHNWGIDAQKGVQRSDRLLLVQGPLHLNWKKRKYAMFPGIENAALEANNPVSMQRIKLWIKSNVHVKKQKNVIFIKLHTHGCKDSNIDYLLNGELDSIYSYFEKYYNDGINYCLHYVTAREMINIIRAIEEDNIGNDINSVRDYQYRLIK